MLPLCPMGPVLGSFGHLPLWTFNYSVLVGEQFPPLVGYLGHSPSPWLVDHLSLLLGSLILYPTPPPTLVVPLNREFFKLLHGGALPWGPYLDVGKHVFLSCLWYSSFSFLFFLPAQSFPTPKLVSLSFRLSSNLNQIPVPQSPLIPRHTYQIHWGVL